MHPWQNAAMQQRKFALDPRYFQVIFQTIFLSYGLLYLGWKPDWLHYATAIGGCLFFNYLFESIRRRKRLPLTGKEGFGAWGLSVLISAASLCLLLKTNHWYSMLLASGLTVASKYLFRIRGKHVFN